jgi:hypothetical protein
LEEAVAGAHLAVSQLERLLAGFANKLIKSERKIAEARAFVRTLSTRAVA